LLRYIATPNIGGDIPIDVPTNQNIGGDMSPASPAGLTPMTPKNAHVLAAIFHVNTCLWIAALIFLANGDLL